MPKLQVEGCYNFRDTGGLPLRDGGMTRPGILYRSDALTNLTQTGLDELAHTAVGVIVDFRTPQEREAGPDRVPDSRPFQMVELPFLEGAMADMTKQFMGSSSAPPTPEMLSQAMSSIPPLSDLYIGILQHGASELAQVARLIAASNDTTPTAVLVHCTAGKDRTGVATALMLEAAGVERSAVVADYASSQQNLSGPWADGMLQMVSSMGVPLTPELETLVTGTPPEEIEKALDWVDAHGGAADYLRSGGLTDDELAGLRTRFAG
ncbi:tyrosine-protein phosphatase [Microbacterium sp. A204]|uniref:tyrosine-protein phosphatase n=1 Tax=Microbacterium sp. A204 TaxID=3457321 RepID=UPI003FD4B7D2